MGRNYDDVLKILGEFGTYQKLQYFLVCLVSIVSSWHSMNMVFVGPTQEHYCRISKEPLQWENLTRDQKIQLAYPLTSQSGKVVVDSCRVHNLSDIDWDSGNFSDWLAANKTQLKCSQVDGWVYSTEYYTSTIVSEWDLVCDDAWQRAIATTIFFAGRLVGAFISGQLSDRFGRRPVFFCAIIMQALLGTTAAFSPVLPMFYAAYFFLGVAQVAVFLSAYVIGTEVVGASYRKMAGICINYFYILGQILLTLLAYGIRRWRYLELAISLPSLILLSFFWFLPESIRWLMSRGKKEEADKILQKSAKINKVKLPENIIDELVVKSPENNKTYTFLDLLKTWTHAKVAINIWFNWMINSLVYYGLSLNTSNLAGDPYLNFFISTLVELPGLTLSILLLDRVGRRPLLIVLMLIGGFACIGTGLVTTNDDLQWLATTLSMVGKFGISASYAIIYLVAAEVFPTVVRNVGMGMSSVFARVGGMVAPQFLFLGEFYKPLPLFLFGGLSIVAALLSILLPEPMGKPLPQTLVDISTLSQNVQDQDSFALVSDSMEPLEKKTLYSVEDLNGITKQLTHEPESSKL